MAREKQKLFLMTLNGFSLAIALLTTPPIFSSSTFADGFSLQAYEKSIQTVIDDIMRSISQNRNNISISIQEGLAKEHALAYLEGQLDRNSWANTIQPYIQYNLRSGFINDFYLHWSHLAVIKGDHELIRYISENGGQNTFSVSHHSWLPAHFTALHAERSTLSFLEEEDLIPGDERSLSDFGGTPQDSFAITHFCTNVNQVIQFWNHNSRVFEGISIKGFQENYGKTFIDSIKIDPQLYVKLWKNVRLKHQSNKEDVKEIVEKHPHRSPFELFYIDETPHPSASREVIMTISQPNSYFVDFTTQMNAYHLTLAVKEPIEEDQFIDFHPGLLTDQSRSSGLKYDEDKQFLGFLSFVQEGFPNIMYYNLIKTLGAPAGTGVFAISEILPGTSVRTDFGVEDPIKLSPNYTEVGAQELDHWLETTSPKQTIDDLAEKSSRWSWESFKKQTKLEYIISTPQVFLRLLLENKITVDDVSAIIEYMRRKPMVVSRKYWLNTDRLELIDKSFQSWLNHPDKDRIRQFIEEKMRNGMKMLALEFFTQLGNLRQTEENQVPPREPTLTSFLETQWKKTQQEVCRNHQSSLSHVFQCPEI